MAISTIKTDFHTPIPVRTDADHRSSSFGKTSQDSNYQHHFFVIKSDRCQIAMAMEEEDYWNNSDVKAKAISFDEDEPSQQFSKLGAEVRADLGKNSTFDSKANNGPQALLPLHILLSNKALETLLLSQSDIKSFGPNQTLADVEVSASIIIRRIVLSRPYSLNHFKSFKSKVQLLDAAIAIGDGNAILAIVLFIVKTLKKKLVHHILSSRPVAVNHYIDYLTTRMKVIEVTDLLIMLGRSADAAMKQYQIIMESSGGSIDVLINKLKNLLSNHFSQPAVDTIYSKLLTDYIKLLEWQKFTGNEDLHNKSAIHSLTYCCTNHWSEGPGKILSPQTISQQQQISPMQFDWTALSTQAVLKNWDLLETMFIKKNFLGKATLSCNVPLPKIIGRLQQLGANTILLGIYLNHISSLNQRLELALKYKANRTVVDCFVQQKDRSALTQYKMTLHPQSEEYFHAENALRTAGIKWKN